MNDGTKISIKESLFQVILMLLSVAFVQMLCSYAAVIDLNTFLLLSFVIAIPIWLYKVEYVLFRRRAELDFGANDSGNVKNLLWKGDFRKAHIFVISYFYAVLLITFGSLFEVEHWFVIYVDVFIIVWIIRYSSKFVDSEAKSKFSGLFHRKLLHIINFILITCSIVYLEFSVIGSINYGEIGLQGVFKQNFDQHFSQSSNQLTGFLIGFKAGVDATGWYLMQNFVPGIPDYLFKLLAWMFFLVPSAISVAFILYVLLGVLSLAELKQRKDWSIFGDTLTSKSFMATLLVLTSIYFYAVYGLSKIDFSKVNQVVDGKLNKIDFCNHGIVSANQKNIASELNHEIEKKVKLIELEVNRTIEEDLITIFNSTEKGVDEYLDWYYTVTGEYERLWSVIDPDSDVVKMMSDKLQLHVFENTHFSNKVDSLDLKIKQLIIKKFNLSQSEIIKQATLSLKIDECTFNGSIKQLKGFEGDLGNVGAAGAVAIGRVTTKGIGKNASAAIITKILGKGSFKIAAKLFAKVAVKTGTKVASGTGGAAGGAAVGATIGSVVPVVGTAAGGIVGGIIGGVVTWLVVDKIIIETEEIGYRDDMRAEMLDALNEQRPELEKQFKDYYASNIRIIAYQMSRATNKRFIPARDGI